MTPPVVLLVHDHPDMRESLRELLLEYGYRVITAGSVGEALSMLDRESISVVVWCVRIPGPSALELLALLRRDRPEIPVVIITEPYEVPLDRAKELDTEVLEEPVHPATLLEKLRQLTAAQARGSSSPP